MELLPETHGSRFVVPAAITVEQLEESKRGVCALLPFGTKYEDWYPPLVLSYASGRRTNRKGVADDCDGSGPGVMYAKGLMEFLHERGLQCFSGLQVPPGVDWETFMLRLTGENGKREKPKVLIIILTAGLFHSRPCLKEIDTAIKNKIALLPVRFEDKLPAKEEQWTNLDDPEWEMRKFRVQEKLNSLNNIPNPGTVLNRPTSLQDIVAAIEKHLPAPPSPATSTPTPPPPPPTKPPGGPSEGPRFPVGSRVYVDQGHGQARLGHVATYNAAKGTYTVEIGERGSGALEICFDKDLRRDDNPMSLFIDSARERVGSLFGVIPSPPPPGLKLEGGSLPGNAAKYPGTYRLVVGKLVNGRPAYQHTSDATRWIAFDGESWMGQLESLLGETKGSLDLRDPAAASPDVSTMTWKANGGAGSAWVEAPQLKCTAWTPPPLGLKLEGGSLPGNAAKYPGTYRLVVGKLVNGRPAYQHTSDATRWIAFDGESWMGQLESLLGETKGSLDLRDPAAASPDVSTMTWKANGGAGSAWVEAPQLKCTAWTPPPPPPPPPSACVLLIIGECGDGKSTLVNALRDPARSEGAKAGLATRGVTKDIRVFEGKPIKGRAIQIMDTPGIGDQDVTPLSLVAMIEAKLSDHPIPISGVIVTTPATDGRIKLGAQVVQMLVEHGFVGEHKWDSIILVGTKSDRANEDEKAFFRNNVVKDFFGKAPPGTSPKFALTTKEDVSQLVTQIGSLPGVPIDYVQPETTIFAQALAAKFGIPVEVFSTAFDQMRDQLASQAKAEIEKERRALEQLRQNQAAAEAKTKADASEMARKLAALQEQMKQSSGSATAALARAQEQARQAKAAAEAKAKADAAEMARQIAALKEQLERQQERIVRARPSTFTSVVNGITYLPRLGARVIRRGMGYEA